MSAARGFRFLIVNFYFSIVFFFSNKINAKRTHTHTHTRIHTSRVAEIRARARDGRKTEGRKKKTHQIADYTNNCNINQI